MAAAIGGQGRRAVAVPSRREGKSIETRNKILDAAEELFSIHGLYGVTLRDIAAKTGVDTALLHYYFDSKDNIFIEVVQRRGADLIGECHRELDTYEAEAGDAMTIDGLVAAYLRPVFRLNRNGGKSWRNYCALVLRLSNSPDWASEIISEHFDPLALKMIKLLKRAMPECDETNLYWAHQMFVRVMTITNAPKGRLERLSDGRCKANDFDTMEPLIVRFTVEGIRGICTKN
ncbi:MAG TPA: TetR/AcrR family transcriptional regulator [Rhizomicrobium sp.]|jgi:AcrR family transcriptional regulator|nr:TetR/AcrR family transcriptional regulator [Rhizomicrobium sp.]